MTNKRSHRAPISRMYTPKERPLVVVTNDIKFSCAICYLSSEKSMDPTTISFTVSMASLFCDLDRKRRLAEAVKCTSMNRFKTHDGVCIQAWLDTAITKVIGSS